MKVLPKHLDEEVARLHLEEIGAKLTKLTPDQAAYIGVKVEGPYKSDHYRYEPTGQMGGASVLASLVDSPPASRGRPPPPKAVGAGDFPVVLYHCHPARDAGERRT